ncbi:alpha/beta hydrolase [Maribacter hydrothermalis]|uniref:Alpha/beta hydrolase n=1 Tax=Maribacter hydrothermalis TaxID=1836467 RepID=A0A1B7Z7N0_9FLAO|nr:alpha/beta hydrolase [Maribacter hydrothermalis]APQ15893.1 alpha/beta hydrolase [Maribacter hydrothermalis]OBR38728.1 alpha/beta hydrolase [Maribacter hydrothermalis]
MTDDLIHIYCMPGMAASPAIFEYIKLPTDKFELHYLEWSIPAKGISLAEYAKNMCTRVQHDNVVLLGVSLGGLLVQEMTTFLNVRKVIIVSSVKTRYELPKRMLFARYTKVHKLLPTGLVNNVELLAKYAFGESVVKRISLYERYLSVRDKYYIDWCIDKVVNWKQEIPIENLVHIQGDKDTVFPILHIKDCITLENGTHTMIIHRAKWFNENLPTIILE